MVNDGDFCSKHCNGYCCAKYTVIITTEDIKRILENTPLKPEQFISLYYVNDEILKFFPKIILKSDEVVLGLRQKPDGSCIFFLNELGICGIHQFKPKVCHTYPFTLNGQHELKRLNNICPSNWVPNDIEDLKNHIFQAWKEMEINNKKVELWNKNKSDGNFYDLINFIKNHV